MDLIALVAYLHVSLMWYVSVTFLSKITPRSRTFSVRSMTVLSMNSFSMLGVLVNRDVKKITSVFSALLLSVFWVFHCITSSMQGWRVVRDGACFAGSIAYCLLFIVLFAKKLYKSNKI